MQTDNQQKDNGLHKHIGISDIVAHWFVLLFAIPVGFIGSVLGQFLKRAVPAEKFWEQWLSLSALHECRWGFGKPSFKGCRSSHGTKVIGLVGQGWLTLPFNILFGFLF
jgi:hypothetical protein